MTEQEAIDRVIIALKRVEAKKLLIIELANRFVKDGELDYKAISEAQPEVNMAIAEAKMYGVYTLMSVDTLKHLEAMPQDVGPRHTSLPE